VKAAGSPRVDFGLVLPQLSTTWEQTLDAARYAESIGADSVWVIDHVLGFRPDGAILEAWTVLSALAACTKRVEIGAQVLCQSFRNPALLAKMTATLDQVSAGRVRALIGAGWFEPEYRQYGWEFPPGSVRVEQLRDAVRILRGMLAANGPFTYQGKHYSVHGAVNTPSPARTIPIEVGGAGDRMLRLIAAEADGWNCPASALANIKERAAFLARACEERGRTSSELRRTVQIVCAVGDDQALQHPALANFAPQLGLVGSVDTAARRMSDLIELGFTGFYCIVPPGSNGRACFERLVNDVRPRVLG